MEADGVARYEEKTTAAGCRSHPWRFQPVVIIRRFRQDDLRLTDVNKTPKAVPSKGKKRNLGALGSDGRAVKDGRLVLVASHPGRQEAGHVQPFHLNQKPFP